MQTLYMSQRKKRNLEKITNNLILISVLLFFFLIIYVNTYKKIEKQEAKTTSKLGETSILLKVLVRDK
jgi:cell division protein FtsN